MREKTVTEPFEFTIVATGLDHEADDFEARFFEAGCADATIMVARGSILLRFARRAGSLEEAVAAAVADTRRAGATVDRVEPDPLVSLSDIAERAGLTRAAVSNYAKGERGREFPHPVARVTSESPLWDWSEVARWLHGRGQVAEGAVRDAAVIKAANERLDNERRHEAA